MRTDIKTLWKDYPDNKSAILFINMVNVATVQEGDRKPFAIYTYDSDWADIFHESLGGEIIDDFDTMDAAKRAAEGVFLNWLDRTTQMFGF